MKLQIMQEPGSAVIALSYNKLVANV